MLKNQVQLIAYPNRMGDSLGDLYDILEQHFSKAVGGVHILPIYPSNADGGFSPLTHKEVDPSYGDWDDVQKLISILGINKTARIMIRARCFTTAWIPVAMLRPNLTVSSPIPVLIIPVAIL